MKKLGRGLIVSLLMAISFMFGMGVWEVATYTPEYRRWKLEKVRRDNPQSIPNVTTNKVEFGFH